MAKRTRVFAFACALLAIGLPASAATVTVGSSPYAVAVNPATNKIYVANNGSGTVTVIDGATNSTATVTVGSAPEAIGVNPVTNKIYVGNHGDNTVTIIDGATNNTTTVTVGQNPESVAVNTVTNTIYVASSGSGARVTIIDGATNATSSVSTPVSQNGFASVIAVNPVTNKVYLVADAFSIRVIDANAGNATTTVSTTISPSNLVVNPITNKIYIANSSNRVDIVDGATNAVSTINLGTSVNSVAVNPVTNKVYIVLSNSGVGSVAVLDANNNNAITNVPIGNSPRLAAVNTVTNTIYVSSETASGTVTVIDGATNITKTVNAGSNPISLAVNPVTNKVYAANLSSANVTVIDGATNATATVSTGSAPQAAAANSITNKIYVANNSSNNVTVIDGATNTTTTVAAGSGPSAIAVNPAANKVYVANGGGTTVTVIDAGNSNATSTVNAGSGPNAIAVNPVTSKIYVTNYSSSTVTVIDANNSNATATVTVGTNPVTIALNPITNKIYVASQTSNTVTIIDGATNAPTSVNVGTDPSTIAVNPVTNKIYVTNYVSGTVSVIDGGTGAVTATVTVGTSPQSLVVNPVSNRIYVGNFNSSNVTVIDGSTDTVATTVAAAAGPAALNVNAVTNKIYVANQVAGSVTVIDGVSNTPTTVTAGSGPSNVAVNPVTGKIYVANHGGSNVTVISEQTVNAIPLTTAILPLTPNPGNATPSFQFLATSTFSPTAPTPQHVFYQLDTWQGNWIAATGTNPTFSATTTALPLGLHTLYAYATDGQDATSTSANSPLIGAIQAFGFLITPPLPIPPTVTSLSPVNSTGNTTFTVQVSDFNGAQDIGLVYLLFNTSLTPHYGCLIAYDNTNHFLLLFNDDGQTLVPGVLTPGGSGNLANTRCQISAGGASASIAGNNLTVSVPVTFLSGFVGTNTEYVDVVNKQQLASGYVAEGTWTGNTDIAPTIPGAQFSGTGSPHTFLVSFNDARSGENVALAYVIFGENLALNNTCVIAYSAGINVIYLLNDAGTGLAGAIAPGAGGTASNSQCTIASGGTTVVSGTTLTVPVNITFAPRFGGLKNAWGYALSSTGLNSGFVQIGSWSANINVAPGTITETTPTGTGSGPYTFGVTYSDGNGYLDIENTTLLITGNGQALNACDVVYSPPYNALFLLNDAGTGYVSGFVTPGVVGTPISNTHCTLQSAGAPTNNGTTNLTVPFQLTFASFSGAKTIYGQAFDSSGAASVFQTLGTITLP